MNEQLRHDIKKHPDILRIENPLSEAELSRFTGLHHPPADLLDFWKEFGSGEVFESEYILRPFEEIESIELITEQQNAKGFPPHLTVFHVGIFVSGFDSDGFEVFEPDSYKFVGRYFRLDDWYVQTIRLEFAERYGLRRL
jgi:hypothetical protein